MLVRRKIDFIKKVECLLNNFMLSQFNAIKLNAVNFKVYRTGNRTFSQN